MPPPQQKRGFASLLLPDNRQRRVQREAFAFAYFDRQAAVLVRLEKIGIDPRILLEALESENLVLARRQILYFEPAVRVGRSTLKRSELTRAVCSS